MKKLIPSILIALSTSISISHAAPNNHIEEIKSKLNNISPTQFSDVRVEPSIVNDYYQVISKNGAKVYTNKDVTTFISGDLIVVDGLELKNATAQENRTRNKKIVDDLVSKYNNTLVYYPNLGKEKVTSIYVFTDFTCPYCRKLHQNLQQFLENGIEVHYIPFPRNTMADIMAVRGLQKIICSPDKKTAFDLAFANPKKYALDSQKSPVSCPEAVDLLNLHNYADLLGIQGTPTAFTEKGTKITGFNSAQSFAIEIRKAIDDEKKWIKGNNVNENK